MSKMASEHKMNQATKSTPTYLSNGSAQGGLGSATAFTIIYLKRIKETLATYLPASQVLNGHNRI